MILRAGVRILFFAIANFLPILVKFSFIPNCCAVRLALSRDTEHTATPRISSIESLALMVKYHNVKPGSNRRSGIVVRPNKSESTVTQLLRATVAHSPNRSGFV